MCPKVVNRRRCAAICPIWNFGWARPWVLAAPSSNATKPTYATKPSHYQAGSCRSLKPQTTKQTTAWYRLPTKKARAKSHKFFGDRAFNYAKPLSLIQGLLQQATRPGDTVLDFFAGSGTTGHAVLALNAQDGGQRRFILCSSTEATAKEPNKNLCRDVCAERIRRVITTQWATAPALPTCNWTKICPR